MDTYSYNNSFDIDKLKHYNTDTIEFFEKLEMYKTIDEERVIFRVLYNVLAVFIVVFNGLLIVSVFVSRKQRDTFRYWLLLHVTIIHTLFGGIVCPFLGHKLAEPDAGLGTVLCKLLSFITDTLDYTANVSLLILGIYQCITMLSPRMLKGVANTLLTSVMIIIPWLMCVMLTAVLRLTMLEEVLGQCYIIQDRTAQTLWMILAYVLPLFLILICFVWISSFAHSPLISVEVSQSPPASTRKSMTYFVAICLGSYFVMRTPFYIIYAAPIDMHCRANLDELMCLRLTYILDMIRLSNMLLIPLVYLIPTEIIKCYRKLLSKILHKSVDCESASKKLQMEMVVISQQGDRTMV